MRKIKNGQRFRYEENKKLPTEDYYIAANGALVFTEAHHLKRGYCCKKKCKHCPYGFGKIS